MSCCQPYFIKNPHFNQFGYPKHWKEYLEVPCGYCLNCRVDKLNWITDACEYEWKKYDYIGSFVTFTYDDIHLFDHNNIVPDDFYTFRDDSGKLHVMPFKDNRPAQYSLCRDDARNFIKRLRSRIKYYLDKHGLDNCDLCRKDFKFIQTGEYGGLFQRPHYHFIFFGLDYDFCKDIFSECWQQGLIDSLPIQDGAFRYVSDYFTKQVNSFYAKELYDDNHLERPYFVHSLGLGKGLILDQLDFIKSHKSCYLNKNDVLRPVPIYYRNVLHLLNLGINFKQTEDNMIQHCIKPDSRPDSVYRYSLKQMNEYKRTQSLLRHKKLEIQAEKFGSSYQPLAAYNVKSFDTDKIIKELFDYYDVYKNYKNKKISFNQFSQYCEEKNIIPF